MQIVGVQDDGVVVSHVEQPDVRLDEVGAVGKGYILLVDMLKYVAVDYVRVSRHSPQPSSGPPLSFRQVN